MDKAYRRPMLIGAIVAMVMVGALPAGAGTLHQPARADRQGHAKSGPVSPTSFTTQDLSQGLTAQDLANALVGGTGVTISNVQYTGAPQAAGLFTGGNGIIEFDSGLVLSSGRVDSIPGPNQSESTSTSWFTAGDPDLNGLLTGGAVTHDAAVLEFDFTTDNPGIGFQYVFASEEYNEFVNSQYNDVFGFFLNGVDIAKVPGTTTIVSINTVNGGNPFGTNATNPQYYRNNSTVDPGPATIDTEMDGLTVQLDVNASVQPGSVNHLKLAVADTSDEIYDSVVLIKSGSFVECNPSFSDVDTSSPFYAAIRYLYCGAVVGGYADGTFKPQNNATRSQLAKIITLGKNWAIDTTGGPHFSDVPDTNFFYPFVETAFNHGAIGGYNDGTFKPYNDVTRSQICKIVVNAMGWPIDTTGGPHFSDVPDTNVFYPFIETAFNKGIISGYNDGTFKPGNSATRGQLSKIIYNALTLP